MIFIIAASRRIAERSAHLIGRGGYTALTGEAECRGRQFTAEDAFVVIDAEGIPAAQRSKLALSLAPAGVPAWVLRALGA